MHASSFSGLRRVTSDPATGRGIRSGAGTKMKAVLGDNNGIDVEDSIANSDTAANNRAKKAKPNSQKSSSSSSTSLATTVGDSSNKRGRKVQYVAEDDEVGTSYTNSDESPRGHGKAKPNSQKSSSSSSTSLATTVGDSSNKRGRQVQYVAEDDEIETYYTNSDESPRGHGKAKPNSQTSSSSSSTSLATKRGKQCAENEAEFENAQENPDVNDSSTPADKSIPIKTNSMATTRTPIITSMAEITRNDLTLAFQTQTALAKEAIYAKQYTQFKELQDEDFAFALAEKKLKNKIAIAAQHEQLARYNNASILDQANTRIQESRLLADADNAHAISNARSRDTVRTLDRFSYLSPRDDFLYEQQRSRDSSSSKSSNFSNTPRNEYYMQQETHDFAYQRELLSHQIEKRKSEHDIFIAKQKNELDKLQRVDTSVTSTAASATSGDSNFRRKTYNCSSSRSPDRGITHRMYSQTSSDEGRAGTNDRRQHSRRSRSRSPERLHSEHNYSQSHRRFRSRSPDSSRRENSRGYEYISASQRSCSFHVSSSQSRKRY